MDYWTTAVFVGDTIVRSMLDQVPVATVYKTVIYINRDMDAQTW